MTDENARGGEKLLYDPMFDREAVRAAADREKKPLKKAVFILVLAVFVGTSLLLSFSALKKDKFILEDTGAGVRLSAFNADKTDRTLEIGCPGGPAENAVCVRDYAVCGNETTAFIFIGPGVTDLGEIPFFDCTALWAVIVSPGNPAFASPDGVLYRLENGAPVQAMLCPQQNHLYRMALSRGEAPAETAADAARFLSLEDTLQKEAEALSEDDGAPAALSLTVPAGVKKIGPLAFAHCRALREIALPEGLEEIADMAFFKCEGLREMRLPDSLRTLGPDSFSNCAGLTDIFIPKNVASIGHHAFFGCAGLTAVRMEHTEAAAPETGDEWLPHPGKSIFKKIGVLYGERRDG